MLPLLLAFPIAPIPAGAYPMPELCRRLTEATGKTHAADATLRDYPVFVATQSGEAARVKRLVAAALHAEWKEEDGKFRLVAVKPAEEPDWPEFDRRFRIACGENKAWLALPAKELYRMPVGQIVRYGPQTTETIRKLPGLEVGVAVRRLASGVFEFAGNNQITLSGLSKSVEEALGEKLTREAVDAETRAELRQRTTDPQKAKFDLKNLDLSDPIAVMSEPMLKPVAAAVGMDVAAALSDASIFPVMMSVHGDGKVKSVLESYSAMLDWSVVDGALVGRLTMTERLYSTQTRRSVLQSLVKNASADGVASVDTIGRYVAEQRPGASEGWNDAGLMILGGVLLDEAFIGHYPFNTRLYTRLGPQDWNLIRSGEAFPASAFTPATQRALRDLLLHSRDVLAHDKVDPGFWPSVRPDTLTVRAELVEQAVLIGFTSLSAEIDEVGRTAWQYDMRRKSLGREPLYRPATRRSLKLTISRTAGTPEENVVTGFSEVHPDPNQKAVEWRKLPKEIAEAFSTSLEEMRKAMQNQQNGDPPPPSPR
ncbi:MAG: hypothetical protein ACO1SV_14995 [Fimbriimonas sp.]